VLPRACVGRMWRRRRSLPLTRRGRLPPRLRSRAALCGCSWSRKPLRPPALPRGALIGRPKALHVLKDDDMTRPQKSRVREGNSQAHGAIWDGDGTTFTLFSAHATKVELCLFG